MMNRFGQTSSKQLQQIFYSTAVFTQVNIYRPVLHQKITFKSINDINEDIVLQRKFNYAYIFTDSAAEYLDMLLHTYISSAKSFKRTIRIMNEKLSKLQKFHYVSSKG